MTTIRRLTGVYHADGGPLGELAYLAGRLRGTAHCGLCDITHGRLRAKPDWAALTRRYAAAGVPFLVVHRNEREEQVAAVSDGRTPCVLAHTDQRIRLLLGPDELDALGGDVGRFDAALRAAASGAGLRLP